MAADIYDVVDAAADPVVTFVITTSSITRKLCNVNLSRGVEIGRAYIVSFVDIEVGVHVSLVSSPNGAGHAGPWLLEC